MKISTLVPDTEGMLAWPPFGRTKRTIVAVGNFDGVHKGHQAVLRRTVDLAKSYGATSVAIVFEPRPAVVISYAKAHDGNERPVPERYDDPEALTGLDQRLALIERCGIDHAIVVRYTMAFGAKSYQFFLGQLVGRIGMRDLVLGKDAHIGRGRSGDVKAIDSVAQATRMFELDVVDDRGPGDRRVPLTWDEESCRVIDAVNDPDSGLSKVERRSMSKKVPNRVVRAWSSTYVRYLLAHGHVAQAAGILGRPHMVDGVVVPGRQRGRTLGFPTANVGDDVQGYMPADGVYAGWLTDLGAAGAEDEVRRYPAAISIGTKETFGEPEARVLEAFALVDQVDGEVPWIDLYGHKVRVEFLEFLRPQEHYDSADALVAELRRNVEQTRRICAGDR